MIRKFVETELFEKLVSQENDKELEKAIKDAILENPNTGDLISGTGGLRKLRVADKKSSRGKSGSFRVLYLDLPKHEIVYLLFLFPKSVAGNITAAMKAELKKRVMEIKDGHS